MSTDKKWLIKNLCVFCGSSSPKDPALAAGAKGLTDAMLSRGIGLVYGGGTHGMMGLIGKAIHEGMLHPLPRPFSAPEPHFVAADFLTTLLHCSLVNPRSSDVF